MKKQNSEKVKELQSEYQVIVTANAEAPPGKQITKDELELDPEITQLLHGENERKIQEVCSHSGGECHSSSINTRPSY